MKKTFGVVYGIMTLLALSWVGFLVWAIYKVVTWLSSK